MENKAKKILIFSTAYFPFVGGAEVAVKEITDRIFGIEFSMITARMDSKLPKFERLGNIDVYRVGIGLPIFDKLWLIFRGAKFAKKLHKKNKYEAIWSIMASFGGFAALVFKRKNPDVRFLLTLQEGDNLAEVERKVRFIKRRFRNIFISADYIQAISNYLADWAKKMGAVCPVEVVPNGVDINQFFPASPSEAGRAIFNFSPPWPRPVVAFGVTPQNAVAKGEAPLKRGRGRDPARTDYNKVAGQFSINEFKKKLEIKESEKIVLTASRLVPKNGVGDLIAAMKYVPDNVKLLICGSGQDEKELKDLSKRLGLSNRIIFLGHVLPEELPKYYAMADVFCRPSLSEGLGNVFLEAMAAGVPVVATPVGGIPDFLVDGQTGWFCRVKNPESIAEKIKWILDEKNVETPGRAFVQKVVNNAKVLVKERYNWDKIAKKMDNIFNKLI